MTILRLEDGVKGGLCCKGQRRFCESNGIDFRDYARNGIDIKRLEGIVDANLERAIAAAKIRESANGQG